MHNTREWITTCGSTCMRISANTMRTSWECFVLVAGLTFQKIFILENPPLNPHDWSKYGGEISFVRILRNQLFPRRIVVILLTTVWSLNWMCLRFLAVSQVLAISAETMRLEAFSVGGRGEGAGLMRSSWLRPSRPEGCRKYLFDRFRFWMFIYRNVDIHLTPPGFALFRPILSRRLFWKRRCAKKNKQYVVL